MVKKVLWFCSILFVTLLYEINGQVTKSDIMKDWNALNLKGNVKSIKCTNYQLFIPYSELTDYISKQDYKFNNNGSLSEEAIYYYDEQSIRYRYVYEYDKSGKSIKFNSFDKDNHVKYRGEHYFNSKGKKIMYQEKTEEQAVKYKETYDYMVDSDTLISYNSHQLIPFSKDTFQYVITIKDKFEKSEKRYLNHRLKHIYTYKYDIDSNLVEEKEFSHQDTLNYSEKTNYIYNNENQLIFRERMSGINIYVYIQEFTYDSFGNILSEKHSENDNCIEKRSYRNEYLYDNHNNWIKRTTYALNGTVRFVLDREFEYYN
jgi:hypothetical protein